MSKAFRSALTTDPPSLVDLLQEEAQARHLAPDLSSTYLDLLVSLPLHSLLKEPSTISSEGSGVEAELTNLCFREYPIFISVHKCSAAVTSAFDDFEGSLGKLLDSVPALEDACKEFGDSARGNQAVRSKVVLVQEHQNKLVDFLEMPQLLETCVRNGHYQEAMELAAYAEGTRERHPNPLVEDVTKEMEGVIHLMSVQLLALLREPVKLPTLVKAITYLRRLGTIAEDQLGIAFLVSRLHNFRAQQIHIERERAEPARYLRKYIDLFREHVYDAISQYTAIFSDSTRLTAFASLYVQDLVQLVNNLIPKVSPDPASMSSILVQLGYCALSFARVGLDFSALIGEPFIKTVVTAYSQAISGATTALAMTLRNATKNAAMPPDVLVSPDHRAAVLSNVDDVAHFPPLALFTNAHLSALNAVRLLAPSILISRLTTIQAASLLASTGAVLQYLQQSSPVQDLSNGDRPKHSRSPSSPRAHLLRRNTETQLSPEIRAARRREAQRVCVGFAEAWCLAVSSLVRGLYEGVYELQPEFERELKEKLAELEAWIDQHRPQESNGDTATVTPVTIDRPAGSFGLRREVESQIVHRIDEDGSELPSSSGTHDKALRDLEQNGHVNADMMGSQDLPIPWTPPDVSLLSLGPPSPPFAASTTPPKAFSALPVGYPASASASGSPNALQASPTSRSAFLATPLSLRTTALSPSAESSIANSIPISILSDVALDPSRPDVPGPAADEQQKDIDLAPLIPPSASSLFEPGTQVSDSLSPGQSLEHPAEHDSTSISIESMFTAPTGLDSLNSHEPMAPLTLDKSMQQDPSFETVEREPSETVTTVAGHSTAHSDQVNDVEEKPDTQDVTSLEPIKADGAGTSEGKEEDSGVEEVEEGGHSAESIIEVRQAGPPISAGGAKRKKKKKGKR